MFGTIKFTFDIWVCEIALVLEVCVSECVCVYVKGETHTIICIENGSIAHIRWRWCDKVVVALLVFIW